MYMKQQYVNNNCDLPCKEDDYNKTQTRSVYKWFVICWYADYKELLIKLDNTSL